MFALVAALVVAAPGPRIAVHPLVVVGGDARAVEQSRADFQVEALRQPIQLVLPGQVADALASGACPDQPACLAKLCADTGGAYAVWVAIALEGEAFTARAKVIAVDGTVVRALDGVTSPKDLFAPRAPQVQALFRLVFSRLALASLPDMVAAPKPAAVEPPPVLVAPIVPRKEEPGMPPLRIAGLVVGGVAVATAIGGVAYGLSGLSLRDDVARRTNANGVLKSGAQNVAKAAELDAHNATLTGVFGAAGFVAVTSAVMLVVSGVSGGTSASIVPVEGGAVVGFGGTF